MALHWPCITDYSGFIHVRAHGLRKGVEHGVWHTLPFLLLMMMMMLMVMIIVSSVAEKLTAADALAAANDQSSSS